jgi:hypothetical protein
MEILNPQTIEQRLDSIEALMLAMLESQSKIIQALTDDESELIDLEAKGIARERDQTQPL